MMALPAYTAKEVAEHCSRDDLWVVVDGRVLDLSAFAEDHPGGSRALLNLAGTDATAIFEEIHAPNADFVPWMSTLVIGSLSGAPQPRLQPRADEGSGSLVPWAEFRTCQLDSPFPAARFYNSGLEAFRFEWGILERLLAVDPVDGTMTPPLKRWATRQKAKIAPLDNQDRDWLEIGSVEQYAAEMRYRKVLVEGPESMPMVYVSNPNLACLAAEQEVLDLMLEWLPRRHPDRFAVDPDGVTICTLTPGYEHSFTVADFTKSPLRLCGMLVQEDLYLLEEGAVEEQPPLTTEDHAEDHPVCIRISIVLV